MVLADARTAVPGTVLLIEDDDAVREFAREVLRSRGWRVVEAPGPAEALAICTEGNEVFDVVVTDVVMPGLSGGELADRLEVLRPGVPVLFISGYADVDVIGRGQPRAGRQLLSKRFHGGRAGLSRPGAVRSGAALASSPRSLTPGDCTTGPDGVAAIAGDLQARDTAAALSLALGTLDTSGDWRGLVAAPIPGEDGRRWSGFRGIGITPPTITFGGQAPGDLRREIAAAEPLVAGHPASAGFALHDDEHLRPCLERRDGGARSRGHGCARLGVRVGQHDLARD